VTNLLLQLLIGLAAGWLAGEFMKFPKRSLFGNLLLGVVGAVLGGFLLQLLGLANRGGIIGTLVTATIGAVALLWVVNRLKRR
jgi:uncharacterized membrane protein YeaQ/YmgE (transglycosylase-associated protein family)